MTRALSPGNLAQVACLLEATACKPGNVHRFRDFADCRYLDFALSAQAIGPALDRARSEGIGAAVLAAVEATRAVVATNTNLGMILLLAPLAAVPEDQPIREGLQNVLAATTVDDARQVYEAIRQARPGGLGAATSQDVAAEPTVTLTEAMTLAADRDSVARQYARNYADIFDLALPCLARALGESWPVETMIVATHLTVLANLPDTLIARKLGRGEAEEASRRATRVLDAGWPRSEKSFEILLEFDDWLRDDAHARNPGTTADLVTAALFVALRKRLIRLPIDGPAWDGQAEGGGLETHRVRR
jgi:triphosphoribosyl-dephospho-CoA synthase